MDGGFVFLLLGGAYELSQKNRVSNLSFIITRLDLFWIRFTEHENNIRVFDCLFLERERGAWMKILGSIRQKS